MFEKMQRSKAMEEKNNGAQWRIEQYKKFIAFQLERCNDEEALCFVANYLVQVNTQSNDISPINSLD